jgi:hypothetical protein
MMPQVNLHLLCERGLRKGPLAEIPELSALVNNTLTLAIVTERSMSEITFGRSERLYGLQATLVTSNRNVQADQAH